MERKNHARMLADLIASGRPDVEVRQEEKGLPIELALGVRRLPREAAAVALSKSV